MPIVSEFYGITITMHTETNERHHVPHIHAQYQDENIVVAFNGNVLAGNFHNKQLQMVQDWISDHEEELENNWAAAQAGLKISRIAPLERRR